MFLTRLWYIDAIHFFNLSFSLNTRTDAGYWGEVGEGVYLKRNETLFSVLLFIADKIQYCVFIRVTAQ